jgi:hypothetical protein
MQKYESCERGGHKMVVRYSVSFDFAPFSLLNPAIIQYIKYIKGQGRNYSSIYSFKEIFFLSVIFPLIFHIRPGRWWQALRIDHGELHCGLCAQEGAPQGLFI